MDGQVQKRMRAHAQTGRGADLEADAELKNARQTAIWISDNTIASDRS